jgi:hypothetical protein
MVAGLAIDHPAAVNSLIPALSWRSCRPNAPFAKLMPNTTEKGIQTIVAPGIAKAEEVAGWGILVQVAH